MLEYVNGAIRESMERATALKTKFPRAKKTSIHFESLITTAKGEIDTMISRLNNLFYDVEYSKPENVKQKFSKLKSITGELYTLENVIVAAIDRKSDDDDYLSKLVRAVCAEIDYPIAIPVASCLSNNYYQIFPHYNLICLPLLESEFLLHLPDLYHELCHPLLIAGEPRTAAFYTCLGKLNRDIGKEFLSDIKRKKLNDPNSEVAVKMRYAWKECWVKKWSQEIFCDLFATYTLGPGYVWSNLHMCVKMEWDVYHIPLYGVPATPPHPPCDARMRAMFYALSVMGFEEDRAQIELQWNEFLKIIEPSCSPEYDVAVQDNFLKLAASHALEGIKQMKCTLANENKDAKIINLLNDAWKIFWSNPTEFTVVEKEQIKTLKEIVKQAS